MKNRNKYYKKYYKKHKKEAYLKLKKWREKQKTKKLVLEVEKCVLEKLFHFIIELDEKNCAFEVSEATKYAWLKVFIKDLWEKNKELREKGENKNV